MWLLPRAVSVGVVAAASVRGAVPEMLAAITATIANTDNIILLKTT